MEPTVQPEVIRVLLVEDNAGDERLIRESLAEEGKREFRIASVQTLADALHRVKSVEFDAVLLDMHLPDASGLSCVRELALAAPRTPILVVTGLDDDALAIEVSAHGAQDYLVKGTKGPADLSRAVRCAMARKRFEAVLAQQACFDALTGLTNRGVFHDRLTHALERARRARRQIALMFIDLDEFKRVNDAFGHKVGDAVLRAVAEALRGAVRESDTVARLGGDEFAVLLEPMAAAGDAQVVAQKIVAALQRPIAVAAQRLQLTASIGIALFPEDDDSADGLIDAADATMYLAKRTGGNRFRFAHRHKLTPSAREFERGAS